jgi:twitching motility two-component system response regulator PilH
MTSKWMNEPQEAGGVMPKVLIVDDSPAQLYSLRRLVEQAGHQAVVAESGEQALEVAATEHPAVILMDIVMPGMSGYQATRKLSRIESTRHIPVIFVSSRNGEADREWGLRQGAREYVTKPVNPALLLTAISEAMAA